MPTAADYDHDMDEEDRDAVCKFCGECPLHWIDTTEGPRLFSFNERGRPVRHVCKPSASDMPDLSKD